MNFQFKVKLFESYFDIIERSARKNYNTSCKYNFTFQKLDSKKEEDVKRAYTVIKANRESKGYPLRMTLEDVLKTIKINNRYYSYRNLRQIIKSKEYEFHE